MTMSDRQAAGLTSGHGRAAGPTFFKLWMPYLFQRVDHPKRKNAFLPLNRDYVPLGMTRGEWIDYEKVMPTHGVFFARDPAHLDVWWNTRDGKQLWLYDDSVASRLTYFERFEKLMLRQVEVIQ